MNGVVVPVCSYTVFNHSYLVSPGTMEVIVADQIPITPFRVIGASIRVHARKIDAGGSYQVIVRGVNPARDDGADFVFGTDLGSNTAIGPSTNPTTVPGLVQLSTIITDPQHPMARVVVKATGPTAAGSLYVVLSIDLVMRT